MCMSSGVAPALGARTNTSIGAQGAASLGASAGGGAAFSGAPLATGRTVLTSGGSTPSSGSATGPTERAPRNVGQVQRKLGGGVL